MTMFQNFHSIGEFYFRFSESIISLIHKIKSPMSLNDFQPICLMDWVHKLIAKVLTGRLRSLINWLVRHSQTTFICGRHIHDGWIIASEVLDVMKKRQTMSHI